MALPATASSVAEHRAAEAHLPSIDDRPNTVTRFFDRVFIGAAVLRHPRHGGGQRMMARQGEPARRLQKIGTHVAGIDHAHGGQGEGAGLVEDDGIDLRQALEGIARIEEHAGAEEGTGGDHLDHGHGERQRAGAGDDEHGDGGDERIVDGGAAQDPGQRRSGGGHVHDRRVNLRDAVGELHVARLGGGRILQQPFDFVEQCALAGSRHPQGQGAVVVHAPRIDLALGPDGAVGGLSGYEALVDLRRAGHDEAIDGDALARADENPVARFSGQR